jgi:hypothetical protein
VGVEWVMSKGTFSARMNDLLPGGSQRPVEEDYKTTGILRMRTSPTP